MGEHIKYLQPGWGSRGEVWKPLDNTVITTGLLGQIWLVTLR